MKFVQRALAALMVLAAAGSALAAYPERPITFIVPWGAGGGTDGTARYFAAVMEKELGQPVNVVNRTGGGGVANADYVGLYVLMERITRDDDRVPVEPLTTGAGGQPERRTQREQDSSDHGRSFLVSRA